MKNYPNQASSFDRLRGTLETIHSLNRSGEDSNSDEVLGYAAARAGHYTFRGLDPLAASATDLEERIVLEKNKAPSSQGARTFARELRRTLKDLGWLNDAAELTDEGLALIKTEPFSVDEQALLVEGLMNIVVANKDGSEPHRPIPTLLRLLAERPSQSREGLELALEPRDDSPREMERVLQLYRWSPEARLSELGITRHQQANAVKIFPPLAAYAGLIVERDKAYHLSLQGWRAIGEAPMESRRVIKRQPVRRTTVARKVDQLTVAKRVSQNPPRILSPDEQVLAGERLQERTISHQDLVKRISALIGDNLGALFENESSYDLLWLPHQALTSAYLFEMKSITDETDAYAQIRLAAGQLRYYSFFDVRPSLDREGLEYLVGVDKELPEPLVDFLTHENIGVIVSVEDTNYPSNSIAPKIVKLCGVTRP